jgi:hypothetical protein
MPETRTSDAATITPDTELLAETMEFIETHPDEWDQGIWFGSPCCFAGIALELAGIAIDDEWEDVAVDDMPEHLRPAAMERTGEHGTIGVGTAARLVLGLDDRAGGLFAGSNDLDDLRRIVAELCDETVGAGA